MAKAPLPLAETDFATIGLRTTGLEPDWGHGISEVAIIAGRLGDELERFSTSSFADALPHVNRLIARRILVCYNTTFDLGFLRAEYRANGGELPALRTIDVMAMARRFLPELGRYPLNRVADRLGISSEPPDSAMAAAETTWQVFSDFATKLSAHGIDSIDELEAMSRPTSPLSEALRRDKLKIIDQARGSGRRVHLIYRALDEALTEREVTPLEVRTETGKAQLQGFCHLRNAERTFNVDAIQDIEIVSSRG